MSREVLSYLGDRHWRDQWRQLVLALGLEACSIVSLLQRGFNKRCPRMETSDVSCCLHSWCGPWACPKGFAPNRHGHHHCHHGHHTLSWHHQPHDHHCHHLYSTATFLLQVYLMVNAFIISLGVTTTAVVTIIPITENHYSQPPSPPNLIIHANLMQNLQGYSFFSLPCPWGQGPQMTSVLILCHCMGHTDPTTALEELGELSVTTGRGRCFLLHPGCHPKALDL